MGKTSAPGMPGVMGCPDVQTAANDVRSMPAPWRWLWWLVVLAGLVAMLALAFEARAQMGPNTPGMMRCHDRSMIVAQLAEKYGEAQIAAGLHSNGNLIEVYSSEEKDTWTVISSTPDGMSCIVAAGKGWQQKPVLPGSPA
jgi:hypothetical protein